MRTVGGRRAGGAAVQAMDAFQWGLHHGALPQNLAVGAIHAMEQALLFLFVASNQKNPVTPDDWGGVAFAGNGGFPEDVFGGTPFGRDVLFQTRAIPARAAPSGPVFSGKIEAKNEQSKQGR